MYYQYYNEIAKNFYLDESIKIGDNITVEIYGMCTIPSVIIEITILNKKVLVKNDCLVYIIEFVYTTTKYKRSFVTIEYDEYK